MIVEMRKINRKEQKSNGKINNLFKRCISESD